MIENKNVNTNNKLHKNEITQTFIRERRVSVHKKVFFLLCSKNITNSKG